MSVQVVHVVHVMQVMQVMEVMVTLHVGNFETLFSAAMRATAEVCGSLCMLMHVGFAMVETGTCRARNASDLLIKNVLNLGRM